MLPKEVEVHFQKNRTSKTDQLDKLREVLKGQAKLLVPESTEDIDKAWEILVKHYTDPSNTMKARKDALLSIGKLPSDTSKTNSHMKQVEWYIKLDHIIGEIIELGGRNTEMEREAFCQSTNVPPPAIFMFSHVIGKTRPLNSFYDGGCSDCLWKEGVTGNELKGIITQR